jgi:hypothetical protein
METIMSTNHSQDLSEKAVAAMKAAVRGVMEDHRRRRRPLALWENGKVVYRDADSGQTVREDSVPYGTGHSEKS